MQFAEIFQKEKKRFILANLKTVSRVYY